MTVHNAIKMMGSGDSWPQGNFTEKDVYYARRRFGYNCVIEGGRFRRVCPCRGRGANLEA
jgi:hypothetical protein